jgi:REP element-mobilizing transposase RayT
MSGPLLNRHAEIRRGAFLPHWTSAGAIYHTVFRLTDSLPAAVIQRFREEEKLATPAVPPEADLAKRVERYLDEGHGNCWLSQPKVAALVARAVTHFESTHYELHAWCVMPNHVHVVMRPLGSQILSDILHSWKSFTAKEANRMLGREGSFWQKESYDHIVRDADELQRTIRYVCENPHQAGLKDCPWVWPK